MIPKIGPSIAPQQKTSYKPSFCSSPSFNKNILQDEFIKSAPKTISEALKYLSDEIKNFNPQKGFKIDLKRPSDRIVLNELAMIGEKGNKNDIIVSIKYTHPNASGLIPVAYGTPEDITKTVSEKGFAEQIFEKLKKTSDKVFFNKDPEIIDL